MEKMMFKAMYGDKAVRMVLDDDGLRFIIRDVCDILGYNNPNRILNRLGNTRREYAKLKTDGGIQNIRLVTDDEVCKLLCNARTRATPAFADWYFDTLSPLSKMFNRRCCK